VKTIILSSVLCLAAGVTSTLVAQAELSTRVASAMPAKYSPPACGIKAGHFKVSSGASYLKVGVENEVPENRSRALSSGKKVLLEAIQQNDQGKNPAAWYYLGNIYLRQGDIVGADTALTKAEQLAPACKKDITDARSLAWVPLVNAGITFTKEQKNDSALVLLRQANTIYREKPQAYQAAGVIFANSKMDDSAVVYLQKAADISNAANMPEDRNQATYNLAAILQRSNRNDEAIAALERYLTWVPKDIEAKKALAALYRTTGKTDKAKALDQELLATPGAGGAGAGAATVGTEDVLRIGVNLYNEKRYPEAAAAFEKAVAADPFDRDALYNLSNTYLALKNGPKLLATSERLVAIEPLNETSLKLLGEGYRQSKKIDNAVKVAERVLALPVDIKVTAFNPSPTGAKLTATATGRQAQTTAGKPLPPAPMTLVFEFLNQQGTPVTTQEAQLQPLKGGASQEINLDAQGSGITAWRYKKK
jgi:tetratricopeptide (TPR) repeat protein